MDSPCRTPRERASVMGKLDLAALGRACWELAHDHLLSTDPNVDAWLCQTLAEKYTNEALFHQDYLVERGRDPNILVGAVRYLMNHHSVPPLARNGSWFRDMLAVLVEIACPHAGSRDDEVSLYAELQRGIEESLADLTA
jgi:hypothetical protein